jgi:hypothetical protein
MNVIDDVTDPWRWSQLGYATPSAAACNRSWLSDRRRRFGDLRMHLLITDAKLLNLKEQVTFFSAQEGFTLGTVYAEGPIPSRLRSIRSGRRSAATRSPPSRCRPFSTSR